MDIPSFFSEKEKIINFDYSSLQTLIDSELDHSTIIENLSPPIEKTKLIIGYFKSIIFSNIFTLKKIFNFSHSSHKRT